MACTGLIQPFDLECLFVNLLSGSVEIFTFLAFIVIAALGAYFKMLNSTVMIMLAIFGILMAQFISGIYFIILLAGGLVIGYVFSKIVKG